MKGWQLALIAALLIAPACASPDEDEVEDLYLPTAAEAQAKADADISAANADKEFMRLEEEIQADQEQSADR